MIYPVPPGVTPNSHHCGNCGGRFRMPLLQTMQPDAVRDPRAHVLVCLNDRDHDTYQKKDTGTKWLAHADGHRVEVDVLTQREVTELAPITDEKTALATVNRAVDLGLFPDKNQTAGQLALLATVALAYRLDPLMGEIIPYQGKPYITIAGRRRLDNAAGHAVSISFRPPTHDEEAYYIKHGAMADKDFAQFCVGKDMVTGAVVEGFGRVLWSEDSSVTGNARAHLPVIQRKIEMAQKRAERRMREMMFGPVAKPAGLEDITVLEEGDEGNVVEGTATVVEDTAEEDVWLGQGDLGECGVHTDSWFVNEFKGRIQASHKIQGTQADYCRFGNVEMVPFKAAYEARFGEWVKKDVDQWLKDNCNGKTWSYLEPREMRKVRAIMEGLARAHTAANATPAGPEPTDTPPDDDTGLETAPDATGTITTDQLNQLMYLAQGGVPYTDFIQHVEEVTGNPRPAEIPADQFDDMMTWINEETDRVVAAEQAAAE